VTFTYNKDMRKPDFFIVGAPKCGTTAMDDHLRQHPDVFMCRKEPQFFGSDLNSPAFVRDRQAYLSLFEAAGEERRVGETSVWSLYSRRAAAEIKAFAPDARIIIMLRNPVKMLHSLHSEFLYTGNEDIVNFQDALQTEVRRKKGECVPHTATFAEGLFYREVAKLSEQVQRYVEVFGRGDLHFVIFDDLERDVAAVYRDTLSFLDIHTDFRPDFSRLNPNKRVRSQTFRNLSKNPPQFFRKAVRAITPLSARHALMRVVDQYNTRYEQRAPLRDEVAESLMRDMEAEVEQLSKVSGRDLSHWLKAD
jgi:hypothetical protein